MTKVFLIVSVACNVWFLLMLLSDRIIETKFVRFLKGVAGLWQSLETECEKHNTEPTVVTADEAGIIGKSRFRMASTRTTPVPQAATSGKGEEVSSEDVTFDDGNRDTSPYPAQVPAEKLDEVFSDISPSEIGYGKNEPEEDSPDKRQASGHSFDEIGEAVGIAGKDNPTNDEKRQAGKVFSELEGTELLDRLNNSVKVKIAGFIDFYLYEEPETATVKAEAEKELVIPERLEDFNIRDFV